MSDDPHKLDYQTQTPKPPRPMQQGDLNPSDAQKSIILDPAYYRKILEEQKRAEQMIGMEIGGASKFLKLWRVILFAAGLMMIASVFSVLFFYFTHNLRIALIIVTGMLVYMVISAYLAEGHLDNHRRS